MLVYLTIPNLIFVNVFGIIVSISKILGKCIHWVFQYNICWKNLWKFLGDFLLVHYFQNMIEGAPLTWGYTLYFILDSKIFFISRYSSF